jgi:hypothetical protein
MKNYKVFGVVGVTSILINSAEQYEQNREITISDFNIQGKAVIGGEVYWVINSFLTVIEVVKTDSRKEGRKEERVIVGEKYPNNDNDMASKRLIEGRERDCGLNASQR